MSLLYVKIQTNHISMATSKLLLLKNGPYFKDDLSQVTLIQLRFLKKTQESIKKTYNFLTNKVVLR